ncbi:cardiolipin synthase [Clostridium formicaceticum]|uniref:Cardiolipin synthase n=1 Tax=Clostridium formicaceticum TaxID=1497 RepID=A0AAC9RRF9_9CLOT|nr:cardiolipin synthase [Clostridium formicaceticum]AOY75232.1 cardiolipin synthase [Clostridium formicaceticum]ARE89665.1 Major cardiolipin synthase ClsA [Clostridium formicaceticum]
MNILNIFATLFTITTILVSILIILDNRNPSRTVAWLLSLIFLPVVGMFLYLYIGQNHRKKRTFIKKRKQDYKVVHSLLHHQIAFTGYGEFLKKNFTDTRGKVAPLLLNNSEAPITVNNEANVLVNGYETFREMLKAIRTAKHHIHMEYFIIKDSDIGRKFQRALIKKAKEGLEVRVIYDAVGCWHLKESFLGPLRDAGVKLKPFLPVTLPFLGSRLNYRNHRKILVVDGKVGFVGGVNIGDEYLGKNKKMGFWRDTHLKIKGEAVYLLQVIFLRDWFFVSKEELEDAVYFPTQGSCGQQMIQVTSSGPDSYWESIHQAYFSAIATANKKVFITTPYLIPDESILMALKTAAIRGVDVRILLPGRPDHRTVFWASKSHFLELLEAGVKIYQYEKGFVHSKVFIVDDNFSSVGTANLDIRSLQLNFEVNAFIYDEELNKKLKKSFYQDLQESRQVMLQQYKKRPVHHRFKESIARLFSPIL